MATLLALQVPPATIPFVVMPPADWSTLAELAFVRLTPPAADLSDFVREEVRAGRCVSNDTSIRVDLAVLVGSDGRVRRIVPRAINCPTVEQYASGIVSRLARSNVAAPPHDSWYRTTVTFSWMP
ncbi:hypothetical protein M0208_00430 [Sphingomonas sp. SUN019]|uniref:hypothetical protein n=1 Tax=Sphingomonas sp. SUN019 TaxID=2937788 RepID=UPI002164E73A|nr:hypothetical protein [Sphingomonas sp. SUN019]UVO49061.1 hypothetical protein M0208_00430 [Sphingomonas sp. SUN019]